MESTVVNARLPNEQLVRASCLKCSHTTNHAVLAEVVENYEDQSGGNLYWHTANHQTLQCRGCGEFSFRIASTNSEEGEHDVEGNYEAVESVVIYPPRHAGLRRIQDVELWSLHVKLRTIYKETCAALASELPVLAAIGMRAIVETVCKQKNAEGKDLHKRIESLVQLNVLSPGNAQILHHIRSLGNDAAHEVEPHTPEQLALAMDVIDHLIQDVFLLPAKASRLFQRS